MRRYAVVLGHASEMSCGPDLVSSKHYTLREASDTAARIMRAQPGGIATTAELRDGKWLTTSNGQEIRAWLKTI